MHTPTSAARSAGSPTELSTGGDLGLRRPRCGARLPKARLSRLKLLAGEAWWRFTVAALPVAAAAGLPVPGCNPTGPFASFRTDGLHSLTRRSHREAP